jgi:hypothetical protein
MKQYLAEHPEVGVFNPEDVQIMSDALDAAWAQVEQKGGEDAHALRTALAKRIVDLAGKGERNRQRLIEGALAV